MAKKNSKAKVSRARRAGNDSNLMGALAYLLGLVTGVVMYFAKKEDPFVRFHAVQSIIFSVAVFVIYTFITVFGGIFALVTFGLGALLLVPLLLLLKLGFGIVWLYLMYKAYTGEKYELPIIGDFAEKYSA